MVNCYSKYLLLLPEGSTAHPMARKFGQVTSRATLYHTIIHPHPDEFGMIIILASEIQGQVTHQSQLRIQDLSALPPDTQAWVGCWSQNRPALKDASGKNFQ